MDETYSAYLSVRNLLLDSIAITLASNSRLLVEHVRYAPVASLRAVWRLVILFFVELLAEL